MSVNEPIDIDSHPEQWMKERIKGFIVKREINRLALDGEAIYDETLEGFARWDDPLFRRYKRVIGKFHYTLREWMKLSPSIHKFDNEFIHSGLIAE